MNWRTRTALVGAGTLLVALLPKIAGSPLTRQRLAADVPARTSVRVEHELVPAAVIEETAQTRQAVAGTPPKARRHTRPNGFASRARQLIVGTGKHRPQPFPRAGQ
jgi:hypothetical protein